MGTRADISTLINRRLGAERSLVQIQSPRWVPQVRWFAQGRAQWLSGGLWRGLAADGVPVRSGGLSRLRDACGDWLVAGGLGAAAGSVAGEGTA